MTITREVIDHIERKHPQMLSIAGMSGEKLSSSVIQALENPDGVYADVRHTKYFLRRIDHLYLNVIVTGDSVKQHT